MHKIFQIVDNRSQIIHKVNVLSTNAQRTIYGYKLYNIEDAVQLVFDSVSFNTANIIVEVKGMAIKNIDS